eukprot:GILJ01003134.1.p1 GENE.GILJ01003134.1~~GILJ01003134.1.p1  ORF type:complete len:301 (-),score=18.17 GILJ01003134.1:218-1081(-)
MKSLLACLSLAVLLLVCSADTLSEGESIAQELLSSNLNDNHSACLFWKKLLADHIPNHAFSIVNQLSEHKTFLDQATAVLNSNSPCYWRIRDEAFNLPHGYIPFFILAINNFADGRDPQLKEKIIIERVNLLVELVDNFVLHSQSNLELPSLSKLHPEVFWGEIFNFWSAPVGHPYTERFIRGAVKLLAYLLKDGHYAAHRNLIKLLLATDGWKVPTTLDGRVYERLIQHACAEKDEDIITLLRHAGADLNPARHDKVICCSVLHKLCTCCHTTHRLDLRIHRREIW